MEEHLQELFQQILLTIYKHDNNMQDATRLRDHVTYKNKALAKKSQQITKLINKQDKLL